MMTTRPRLAACIAAATLVAPMLAIAQDNAADTIRLIEVLRVTPEQVLADIGAGPEALLTLPMAKAVGPSGKVYATDVAQIVGRVRETIEKSGGRMSKWLKASPPPRIYPGNAATGSSFATSTTTSLIRLR